MTKPVYRPTTCRSCHVPLTVKPIGRPRKYCSARCRQRSHRRSYYQWIEPRRADQANRRAVRTLNRIERTNGLIDPDGYWRKLILVRLSIGAEVPWCRQCRRSYHPSLPGSSHEFCSGACRSAHKAIIGGAQSFLAQPVHGPVNPRVALRLERGLPLKICAHCATPFPDDYKVQRFCKPACRKAHWRETHKRCLNCGRYFEPRPGKHPHYYCSKKCTDRAYIVRKRLRRPPREPRPPRLPEPVKARICVECGEIFVPEKRTRWKPVICSDHCIQVRMERLQKLHKEKHPTYRYDRNGKLDELFTRRG